MESGAKNGNKKYLFTPKLVFLFKAPKETKEDKFVTCLREEGYLVVLIPVLSFKFINIKVLSECLGKLSQYCGILLTSVRTVEAVQLALNSSSPDLPINQVKCFVVGQSTAETAKSLGFEPIGAECGNISELLKVIIKDLKDSNQALLYPCSSIRRDTSSQELHQQGITLEEVTAYITCENEELEEILSSSINNIGFPEFVVFFSPSGVKYTLPVFNKGQTTLNNSKVIAIGPTTEEELVSQNIKVYGVCEKPEPYALLDILHKHGS